ncbi:MAG: glycosyltransferase family 1 protein [Bacteroidales bacterium]
MPMFDFSRNLASLSLKMKIAIDVRLLKLVPDDGISRFTREVVKRLVNDNPGHDFVLIANNKPVWTDFSSKNWKILDSWPRARHPLQWYYRSEFQIPAILKKEGVDVFLSPDGISSLRSTAKNVPVIHDINFAHRPSDIPFTERNFYTHFFRKYASGATRIITVSEFCRHDIATYYNIDPTRIDVAWNGVSEYFSPGTEESVSSFRETLTGGIPYFLFVSNFSPRKNIPGLIRAYNLFRENTGNRHKLVLLGGRLFLNSETDRLLEASPWKKDIIMPGPVLHRDLQSYYSAAEALVFPAWFEGFGIPAAESMRCGTPVILSDTSSLPEVGGEAALYSDPADPRAICENMTRLAGDRELRATLSVKGIQQSMKFTWENTALRVMESLEKTLEN